MFEKIFSVIAFTVTIALVSLNTVTLEKQIDFILREVNELEISSENTESAEEEARRIYSDFKSRETYVSLTVNHSDLTNIEESFAELIGYLSVGDDSGALVTKNRLADSLEHLKRLSGFNIDSII